jgi:RND superfamily putative drug exporter
VDAFIVRMTLVPAVLHLLGDRAWHMPRWLDRVLPSFDVEGEGLSKELALADFGGDAAIAAEGLSLPGQYTDVAFAVPAGGILVVQGAHRSGKSALLLTIAGRLKPESGTLKVAGFVVPIRSAAVRGKVAVVRLAGAADPVAELRAALASKPEIIAIDDLDAVSDPLIRRGVRYELDGALAQAETKRRTLTIVASCVDPDALDELLPDAPTTVVTGTDAATSRAIAKVL